MRIAPPSISQRQAGFDPVRHPSKSEYQFFVLGEEREPPRSRSLPENLKIRVFSPTWNNLRVNDFTSIWLYLFWYWFSVRKYLIYYVSDQEKIVHVSHVLFKNPKFTFMGPQDMEIGPCWTHPEFRGRGIFPVVLGRIADDLQGRRGRLFIFAERGNAASLKGIIKSGGRIFGSGEKSGVWGKYRITSTSQDEASG